MSFTSRSAAAARRLSAVSSCRARAVRCGLARTAATLLSTAATAALVGAAMPASAQVATPLIRLKLGDFDPLRQTPPRVLSAVVQRGAENAASDIYIVQFKRLPTQADRERLQALGARVHTALHDQALLVRLPAGTEAAAGALEGVRWVGRFEADYRLDPELAHALRNRSAAAKSGATAAPQRYKVLLFERSPAARDAVEARIRALGGQVHDSGVRGRLLEATLADAALLRLAQQVDVMYIQPWSAPGNDMSGVRRLTGANYAVKVGPYAAQGVRGEVLDEGVRLTHQDFQRNPGIVHGANSTFYDHGTSTFGIVFGSGEGDRDATGMMPLAQGFASTYNRSFDRYVHTGELVRAPYNAVFQTNSWGSSWTRNYTADSAEMDEIIFDHDILITQSQSNMGSRDSRPQAWAKNIVSVGGVLNRNTVNRSDDCWCGNASIGPAGDGRIKPDLVNAYTDVFTPYGRSNTAYTQFSGTSAATPIVAGNFGLLFQMWADGIFAGGPGQNRDVFASRPHAATAKALMINMARQYAFTGTNSDLTRTHQGWGLPNVKDIYKVAQEANWRLPILVDESRALAPGGKHSYPLDVSGNEALKATLVYRDPPSVPGSSVDRVNDLSLKLTSPSGTVYWGNNGLLAGNWSTPGGTANRIDTVENVFVRKPEAGRWTVEVLGSEIVQDGYVTTPALDAVYALVATRARADNATGTE